MKMKLFYVASFFTLTLLITMQNFGMLWPLNNSTLVKEAHFFTTCLSLDKLRKEKYSHFEELVAKARNDQHEIKNNEIKFNLIREKFLVDEKGNIDEGCRNIILCGVKDKDNRLMLYDPSLMCDPSIQNSRVMFGDSSVSPVLVEMPAEK